MARDSEAVDVVLQEIFCDVAVEEGVSCASRCGDDKENAERCASRQRDENPDPELWSRLRHVSASY